MAGGSACSGSEVSLKTSLNLRDPSHAQRKAKPPHSRSCSLGRCLCGAALIQIRYTEKLFRTVQVALTAAVEAGGLQGRALHCGAARGGLLARERPALGRLRRRAPGAQAQVRLGPLAGDLARLHAVHEAQPRTLQHMHPSVGSEAACT